MNQVNKAIKCLAVILKIQSMILNLKMNKILKPVIKTSSNFTVLNRWKSIQSKCMRQRDRSKKKNNKKSERQDNLEKIENNQDLFTNNQDSNLERWVLILPLFNKVKFLTKNSKNKPNLLLFLTMVRLNSTIHQPICLMMTSTYHKMRNPITKILRLIQMRKWTDKYQMMMHM